MCPRCHYLIQAFSHSFVLVSYGKTWIDASMAMYLNRSDQSEPFISDFVRSKRPEWKDFEFLATYDHAGEEPLGDAFCFNCLRPINDIENHKRECYTSAEVVNFKALPTSTKPLTIMFAKSIESWIDWIVFSVATKLYYLIVF